jgi:hypothetical protein
MYRKSIILTPSQQIYYPDTKSTSLLSWHQVNKSIILTPSQQVYYPDTKSTSPHKLSGSVMVGMLNSSVVDRGFMILSD